MNILFVCTGNTCRSPMAEGMFNAEAERRGLNARASSCGIYAGMPQRASLYAIKAARAYGADIENHMSRQSTFEILESADIVYCMTRTHLEYLKKMYPEHAGKLETFAGKDIDDPFSGMLQSYERIAAQINDALPEIIRRIASDDK